ncbi:expressed unknown protein [Seminavis robusta]|uniref:Uncharacterized protein n=1 Tax=Seminavis robusta TaxID=568900 RepID=A0A9N8E860_9STRA|nr:expressed unknown protein [Seminavis robusta]|eukprot:Sro788_g202590.1 n/a (290) ;mRNA; r:38316-39185
MTSITLSMPEGITKVTLGAYMVEDSSIAPTADKLDESESSEERSTFSMSFLPITRKSDENETPEEGTVILSESENVPTTKNVRFVAKPKKNFFYRHHADSDIWFSNKLAPRNKRARKPQAKAWREKGFGELVKDSFHKPNPSQLTTFALQEGEDNMRGAEMYLCEDLKRTRVEERRRLIEGVLECESTMRFNGEEKTATDEIVMAIADLSRDFSRSAVEYARQLGLADQRAVEIGESGSCMDDFFQQDMSASFHARCAAIESVAMKRRYKGIVACSVGIFSIGGALNIL